MTEPNGWLMTALPIAILAVVVALRLRSMAKVRPLKTDRLWIVPAAFLVVAGSTLMTLPPPPLGWALAVLGLVAGAAFGWYRGRYITITRDPATGGLSQKASPVAMLLLLALIMVKLGFRLVFGESAEPGSPGLLVTDAFIGFALGFLSASRIELYLRAKRILAAA